MGGVSEDYINAQDALHVLKVSDTMRGALQMSGNLMHSLSTSYPPLYKGDEAASWAQVTGIVKDATTNAATKKKVDAQDSLQVLKSGDTMTGKLDMGANWMTESPAPLTHRTRPPRPIWTRPR